jgi:hypothetical protein
MRVGVYIDAYNLYYGARASCGRGKPGWRWLDVRALTERLLARRADWLSNGAAIDRIVYCTARIDARTNPSGYADQDIYLKALVAHGSVDHIEYGKYISKVKSAPLATKDPKGRPVIVTSDWPVVVKDATGGDVRDAMFLVSYAFREEKGSDVNVASHLLLDVLRGDIEAAIVISNDSDLKLPIQETRKRVPVGTVNPSRAFLAGDLRGQPTDGAGGHWWYQISKADVQGSQLPNPVGTYMCPQGW